MTMTMMMMMMLMMMLIMMVMMMVTMNWFYTALQIFPPDVLERPHISFVLFIVRIDYGPLNLNFTSLSLVLLLST